MIISVGKLTKKQQRFAADHHYLVDNFLKFRHLTYGEYYDIIVSGFLRAIRNYFSCPELKRYTFSAIAMYTMKKDLYNYRRKMGYKNIRRQFYHIRRLQCNINNTWQYNPFFKLNTDDYFMKFSSVFFCLIMSNQFILFYNVHNW